MEKIPYAQVGELVSRSLEFQIYNNTQNITLRNPRSYFDCSYCSKPPHPLVAPSSSDTCEFLGNLPFWGAAGVMSYEAESFTLAVHFSNPIDYTRFPMELGLELSPSKVHLEALEDTYARMAEGSPHPATVSAAKSVTMDRRHGTATVSAGRVTVMATMFNARSSILKAVVVEEKLSPQWEGLKERPPQKSEILWDLQKNLMDSLGTADVA